MPQLVRGGKWVYGWVVVGPSGELVIPPEAWREFNFRAGDEVIFLAGSRTSGGFAISSTSKLAKLQTRTGSGPLRELARGRFDSGWLTAPPQAGARPGDRLLAVRGSSLGLGFVGRGPIYEEAVRQTDRLQVFGADR
jgi:hypothetical protein